MIRGMHKVALGAMLLAGLSAQEAAANQFSAFGNVQFGDNKSGNVFLAYGFGHQNVFTVRSTFGYQEEDSQIGGGLGYRYYSNPGEDSFFTGLNYDISDFSEASDSSRYGAEAGYAWRVAENASFDFGLGYVKPKNGDGSASLQMGITVYFD